MKIRIRLLSIMLTISPALTQAQFFQEVAQSVGIDFIFDQLGGFGGGAAWFDYNADGWEDLYLTGGRTMDRLYQNNGNGTFTDVTVQAGLSITANYYTTSVVSGDINNDGYRELFIGTWNDSGFTQLERSLLFRNNGNGTFEEIGVSAQITHALRATGAAFLDFDSDGLLDLYVINYLDESEFLYDDQGQINGYAHSCYPNLLYRNNGDWTFTEMGESLGLNDTGCALAVIPTDYDQNGLIDVYVANDFGAWVEPNAMFRNLGNGNGFEDVSMSSGMDVGIYGMGIAVGDYDLDQDWDYYVTNIGRNVLLQNDGSGHFLDVTTAANVENATTPDGNTTGWGTAFMDYDLDTYEDLFIANGYILSAPFNPTTQFDPNKAYRNNGNGTFTDVSNTLGFNSINIARGLAYADYDADGDADICVPTITGLGSLGGKSLLYNNNFPTANKWLQVSLSGTDCNRDAFGSIIRVFIGNKVLRREIQGGSSHASQNTSIAHFGLGGATQVDSLKIDWLGGATETYYNVAPNQRLHYVQSMGLASRLNLFLNMQSQIVAPEGVFLLSEDFGWPAGAYPLQDLDGDGIFQISVTVPANASGHFTFINGLCGDACQEDLSGQDCANVAEQYYRFLPVVSADTTLLLCFGECDYSQCGITPPDSVDITLKLDMGIVAPDVTGIYLAGGASFGLPGDYPLAFDSENDVYTITLSRPVGFYDHFIFLNGFCPTYDCQENLSGQGCSDAAFNNFRFLPPVYTDTTLHLCFGLCNTDFCGIEPVDSVAITFELNMGIVLPDAAGVYLAGDSSFGLPGAPPLTDENGDGVFSITLTREEGFSGFYTFLNGLCADLSCQENLSGQPCAYPALDDYRYLPPVFNDTTLQLCFGLCDLAQCGIEPIDSVSITFLLNMGDQMPDPTGVYLAGGTHFGLPGDHPMMDEDADGIYSITLSLPAGLAGEYTFANGLCPDFSCVEAIGDLPCADPETGFRSFDPIYQDTVIATCFGVCTTEAVCPPPIHYTDVFFRVDAAMAEPNGAIYLTGSFWNWALFSPMEHIGDSIWQIGAAIPAGSHTYLFLNGISLDQAEALSLPEDAACAVLDGDLVARVLTLSENQDSLNVDVVCFGSCEACPTVSISELTPKPWNWRIYPVSADSRLFIELNAPERAQLLFYDVMGRPMQERSVELGDTLHEVDTASWPTGVYALVLKHSQGQEMRYFSVLH
ncbi:MAG TPA: FG-GAP-like repeat-containing protein [Saprospiraceae bacterium]|nr:FG-GAP-like repeat-containing protein [Saprospiraceae bacterium]HMQ84613.1 FG-GAP-like repeat-containing protein [Saprospiraceae bacterium]